jgi:hypothetical protein
MLCEHMQSPRMQRGQTELLICEEVLRLFPVALGAAIAHATLDASLAWPSWGCVRPLPTWFVHSDIPSSHVRCDFWQCTHARLAFFFLPPSRVDGRLPAPGVCESAALSEPASTSTSGSRLRFGAGGRGASSGLSDAALPVNVAGSGTAGGMAETGNNDMAVCA